MSTDVYHPPPFMSESPQAPFFTFHCSAMSNELLTPESGEIKSTAQDNSPRKSDRFNASDADITISSSDKVLFSIHRKNLEVHTGAFPPAEFETKNEIVELTESSSTLELLFQFIYPQRHPTLASTPYETLALLAEAAEKYEVYSAMNICQIRMANFLPSHADGIMAYAAKHGYHDIADQAAPLAVALPTASALQLFPHHLVIPWVLYRQQWIELLIFILNTRPSCDECCSPSYDCSHRSNLDLKSLQSIEIQPPVPPETKPGRGYKSRMMMTDRKPRNQEDIRIRKEAIQKFSAFI